MAKGKELLAKFKPGDNLPFFADSADITAGRFVKTTGRTTRGAFKGIHAGAGEYAMGVAETDAIAGKLDWRGSTNITRRGSVARVEMGGAVTLYGPVKSDANGKAIAQAGSGIITGYFLGLQVDAGGNATADTQIGLIDLV